MDKKKILFVGAGGELASRIMPALSERYEIVGIGGRRDELRKYCIDFYLGELFAEYPTLFSAAFSTHRFDAIIWNPVHYYLHPLMESSRESLHAEFDMAVALPVECVRAAFGAGQKGFVMVLISSLSAFGYATHLPSYAIVKNAQIKLAEMLSHELGNDLICKVVAPGSVKKISTDRLVDAFDAALRNSEETKLLYKVEEN
jgi:NAD(P)-dependent dehydrogenase (short-subunit alcohol dehydrogenase family)